MNAKKCKKLRKIVKSFDDLSQEVVYNEINHPTKIKNGVPVFPVQRVLADGCSRKFYKKLKQAEK
jgi:hypothetical protein